MGFCLLSFFNCLTLIFLLLHFIHINAKDVCFKDGSCFNLLRHLSTPSEREGFCNAVKNFPGGGGWVEEGCDLTDTKEVVSSSLFSREWTDYVEDLEAVSRLVQGAFIDRTVSGLVSACGGRCIESSLKIPILLTASGVNRLGRRWQKDFEERKDNDLVFRGTRQKWCKKEGRPQKGDLYSPSRFLSTSAVAQMAVDWGDGGSLLVIRHRTAQPIYPFTPSYAWQLEAQILPGGVFRVEACRESVSLTMAYDGTSKEVDVVFLSEEPWEGTQEGEERALEEFDAEKVMQRVRANLASCFPPYCVGLGGTCASVEEKEAPVVEVSDTLLYTQPFRRHEDTECTSAVEEESRSTVEKQANVESVAESPDPVRSQVALRGSAVGCRRGESGRTGAKEKSPACQILQAVPPSWQIQDL